MRTAPTALITMALLLAIPLHAETLADVLTAHKIPVNVFSADEQRQPITSFAVSANNSPFLLAYYDDDGSGMLPRVLHVIRYNQKYGKLRRIDLHGKDVSLRGFSSGSVMEQVSNECMGSALRISEKDGFITIDTHINPSAGCVLILKSDLTFHAGLWGWTLARIGGNILLEGNTIHFASTYPSSLFIYDLRQKHLIPIYPAKNDVKRQEFSAELQKHLPSDQWCRESNNPCNPENFSTDISHVTVNQRGHSFEFDAQMDPEGFGEDTEQAVKPKTVHYTCKRINGSWSLSFE